MKKKISIIATATALALTSIICVYAAAITNTDENNSPCSCGASTTGICGGLIVGTKYKDCPYTDGCTIYFNQYKTTLICDECGHSWLSGVHEHISHSVCSRHSGCQFDISEASVSDIAD